MFGLSQQEANLYMAKIYLEIDSASKPDTFDIGSAQHMPVLYVHAESNSTHVNLHTKEGKIALDLLRITQANRPNDAQVLHTNCLERYNKIAQKDGVMILSMLAYSESFRAAAAKASHEEWILLMRTITDNLNSIEYFAKSRGLRWEKLIHFNPQIKTILNQSNVGERLGRVLREHPHTHVVPEDKNVLLPPTYKNVTQVIIEGNLYRRQEFLKYPRPISWPSTWKYPSDPTSRHPGETCIVCESLEMCDCALDQHSDYAAPLVELRYYNNKGVGVRNLGFIRKGTLLGEYIGEVIPIGTAWGEGWSTDEGYSFELELEHSEPPVALAAVSSQRYGNWTRFVNHSCEFSLTPELDTIGRSTGIFFRANRDIQPFEELTVDYGPEYFNPAKPCLCGSAKCYYTTAKLSGRKRRRDKAVKRRLSTLKNRGCKAPERDIKCALRPRSRLP